MRKALIIDDTKNIRLMLSKFLELEEYTVETASNGKEGLDFLIADRYDLVFLDIKLPEMSGTEVLRRMRAADIHVPVIIITAYPTIKNAVECTRLGVVSYLQKPFTADRLKNVLTELEQSDILLPGDPHLAAEKAILSGNGVQALSILGSALATGPLDPQTWSLLAKAYEEIGDRVSAEKCRKAAALFQ